MNNDEILIVIKDMFEKKIDEVKAHTTVMFEKLDSKINLIVKGHDSLNEKVDNLSMEVGMLSSKVDNLEIKVDNLEIKVDNLEIKVDNLERKVDKLESRVDTMNTDLSIVKNYVIGIDKKLNEHDVILHVLRG